MSDSENESPCPSITEMLGEPPEMTEKIFLNNSQKPELKAVLRSAALREK